MHRKFEYKSKKQHKKHLRLKIYGKMRNVRLKLESSVVTKITCINIGFQMAIITAFDYIKKWYGTILFNLLLNDIIDLIFPNKSMGIIHILFPMNQALA